MHPSLAPDCGLGRERGDKVVASLAGSVEAVEGGRVMPIREGLHAWLGSLPLWQQELARRLIVQTDLDDTSSDEILELVVQEACGGEPGSSLEALRLDEFPDPGSARSARLTSVGSLVGVAAAAEDQILQLEADGLTVIYGANGAGKSTYVRVLKGLLRTVDRDSAIRGHLYSEARRGESAQAVLGVRTEQGEELMSVDLHTPPELGLETVSVFDSCSAEIYLDARNAVAYVPLEVRLLARMATAQDALRSRLAQTKEDALRAKPDLSSIPNGTEAARRVAEFRHTTNLEDLRAFSRLTTTDSSRLVEIRAALASAETRDASADAEAARQDSHDADTLRGELLAMTSLLSPEKLTNVKEAATAERDNRQALQVANAGRDDEGDDIGGVAWRKMWEAARDYMSHVDSRFPPPEGQPCPLCRSPADADTASRLEELEDHVTSTLQQEAERARARLEAVLESYDQDRIERMVGLSRRSIADKDEQLHEHIVSATDRLSELVASVREEPLAGNDLDQPPLPLQELDAWASQRRQHAETLEASLDPDGHARLAQELRELEGRRAVAEMFERLKAWGRVLSDVHCYEAAYSALATNRLTRKQRELSESVVTEMLGCKLREELEALRCDYLPVNIDPHTAVGVTEVAMSLAGAYGAPAVSEVLSEGEQRALALAFFLAEVGCADHDGGVVLDDPVSSLDDERKSYIARRLIEEGHTRQVVVFTHDLPFMLELTEQAATTELPSAERGMWRHGNVVGFVDESPPFTAMKLRQRVGRLKQRIQEWNTGPDPRDEDEAWRRVCDFYAQMRTSWERAVEERLFNGVVQRFQREVKTQSLRDVTLTPELVADVEAGMTRCSEFVHDAPVGTRTTVPTRETLERDLQCLVDFEEATR